MGGAVRLDEGVVFAPGAWEGAQVAATVAHVRAGMLGLASAWGVDVDDVVREVWTVLQRPGFAERDGRMGLLVHIVEQNVIAMVRGDRRLTSGRYADRQLPAMVELRGQVAEIEQQIQESYAAGDHAAIVRFQSRLESVKSQIASIDQVVRSNEVIELVAAEPVVDDAGSILGRESVQACISLLTDHGMGPRLASQLVELVITKACDGDGAGGVASCAERLRRCDDAGWMFGLERVQWNHLVRLVIGSRSGTPGVIARIESGEAPESVVADPNMRKLAASIRAGSGRVAA